jgi:CRP-like cAMP-binding protein
MSNYKQEIHNLFPFLESEDIDELLAISKITTLKIGDKLANQGEVNANMHLILKGLLRSYVITSSGEERTVFIAKSKMRIASFNSILHNLPSEVTIEAIEESDVLVVNSNIFQKVIKSESTLRLLEKQGVRNLFADAVERLHFFTVLSPEERFIQFRDKHPDLLQRVPQKYLASYLGITTVSLSRIKARVAKKM